MRDVLQGPAPQIIFLGTITFHCSFRVPTPTTLFEAVSMRLPVLKLQPDDALLWLCISEFLLVLPIPNNPSDTYYGLSPSVFPSPLPPKPSQALMFLLTHLVPVLLQEEKSLQAGLRTEIFTTFQGNHRFSEASQPHVLPTVFIKLDLQSLLLMMSLTEHTKRPDYISTCQIICFLK